MANTSQELANTLWSIANDLRGNMDSSKFKDYILGVIFYRYLSEKTVKYMNEILKNDGITYEEALKQPRLAQAVRKMSLDHLGYIIEPDNLFTSLIDSIKAAKFSIEDFEKAINSLIGSTIGQESEQAFDKLFDDMNLQDKDLGKEVSDRTELISKVMLKIGDIPFDIDNTEEDIIGTAYMILIGLFQSDAGKKGGEFFTPAGPAQLCVELATLGLDEVENCADPCAGSGSMLLRIVKTLPTHKVGHFYGQEYNGTTYNLLRMNMLMHGVPYKQFSMFNADTIKKDSFIEEGKEVPMQVQVSNPPYSLKYGADPELLKDPRYSSAGVLAPKSHADLMFLEHMVYHMSNDGRIAVLLPHGVLFRGGSELTIRKYLIDTLNCIDAIIGLPANMFHGTSIPVCLIVCKRSRNGNSNNIFFVEASKYFKKVKNTNELTNEDINRIVDAYKNREDIDKFSRKVSLDEIKDNEYNLNIPRYVDSSEDEEEIDLKEVTAKIKQTDKEIKEAENVLKSYFDELGLEFPFGD